MNIVKLQIVKDFTAIFIFYYLATRKNIKYILYFFIFGAILDGIFSFIHIKKLIKYKSINLAGIKDLLGFIGLTVFSIIILISLKQKKIKYITKLFIYFLFLAILIDSLSILSSTNLLNIPNIYKQKLKIKF